jgi:hypothetical protein
MPRNKNTDTMEEKSSQGWKKDERDKNGDGC